ncbi:hypothetical protein DFH94DRAFT_855978 [Russula ochroleuca]|uniref:Uncharacterized protein n=1 Tax=Russula ochroleuca TaxID=152965 RepID=A0A9P5K182_9AGAM|nr:hypothetical protein DFH94DRAFT_855978 [Russula ochroleuca]
MENFHNLVVSAQASRVIVKLWHTIIGLYLWEFFTTLDYEWRVIRGRLPYRWTIWIYSFTRVAALVGVILFLVLMDVTIPINCQLLTSFSAIIFCLSVTTASLLIILRIIAIWNKNRVVVTLAVIVWGISVVSHIQSKALPLTALKKTLNLMEFYTIVVWLTGAAQLRSVWVPEQSICEPFKTESSVLSFIPTIISDIVLLLIMFFGLLILRRHGGGTTGLIYLLWKQGIIWLALATATELPPLVLIVLNSNNIDNILLETPCQITMIIAATRMHRSLVDFASGSSDMAHEKVKVSRLAFSKTKQTDDAAPTTVHQIEIAVDTALGFEQYRTAQIADDGSSDISTESARSQPTASSSPIPQAQSV